MLLLGLILLNQFNHFHQKTELMCALVIISEETKQWVHVDPWNLSIIMAFPPTNPTSFKVSQVDSSHFDTI